MDDREGMGIFFFFEKSKIHIIYVKLEMFLRHPSRNVWRHIDTLIWISDLVGRSVCVCIWGVGSEIQGP